MPSRTKSCRIQTLHVNSHEQCVWPAARTSQDYEQTQGGDGNINRDYRWTGFLFSIFGFKEKILVFSYCLLSKLASLCKLANHVGNSEGLYFKIKDWNDQWNTGFLCLWPQMVLSNFSGFPPHPFSEKKTSVFLGPQWFWRSRRMGIAGEVTAVLGTTGPHSVRQTLGVDTPPCAGVAHVERNCTSLLWNTVITKK